MAMAKNKQKKVKTHEAPWHSLYYCHTSDSFIWVTSYSLSKVTLGAQVYVTLTGRTQNYLDKRNEYREDEYFRP